MTSVLPKPGSFFVRDIPTLSTSVIITRDRSGSLHAFKNVCPHRGMKLCTVGTHSHNRINCPFHGWAFDLAGKLAGLPGEEYFLDFDKDQVGLRSEEHTSELQSLMRISYAVFCLKKQN